MKEVEPRSRYGQFIYDGNDDRICLKRRGNAPSRLPVKKLGRLLQKKRGHLYGRQGYTAKYPVSSKIYCHITCANSRLKRYKGKNPSFCSKGGVRDGFLNEEMCICCLSAKEENV